MWGGGALWLIGDLAGGPFLGALWRRVFGGDRVTAPGGAAGLGGIGAGGAAGARGFGAGAGACGPAGTGYTGVAGTLDPPHTSK